MNLLFDESENLDMIHTVRGCLYIFALVNRLIVIYLTFL
jgi:hypothetical protein